MIAAPRPTSSKGSKEKSELGEVIKISCLFLYWKLLIPPQTIDVTGREKISETIEFPKKFTIIGNLALAFWIALDTVAFLLINIVAGLVFLLVGLIAIYGILKFLGCMRPCYNCKKCTFGLGRLAALYFGKRSLKDYKYNYKLPTAIDLRRYYALFVIIVSCSFFFALLDS
jgi:hypothetical protein